MGREEFLRRTWEWKEKYGGHIVRQLRRLGASCDWDRVRFTLDEGLSRAVREAFVRLYRMGLIYRGEYLVNWSPGLQTAVSDLEVEYSEEDATLYYFKYPIAGADLADGPGKGYIPVATTRPETILGDTAVAVHPDDERYRHLIGATASCRSSSGTIPVIQDTYVDMAFGTGALKITPGHDPNDYEIGQRHGLPIINILDKDARMNENGGPYAGLDRFEARKKLWADMEAAGLTIKTEPYRTQVPRSQRGGEIVEPMVSTQWFVKIKPLAEMGLEAVRSGRITDHPGALCEGVLQLAGEHPRLVHQPPAVVGPPHPGLVLRGLRRHDRGAARTRQRCEHCGSTTHRAGPGRAGHLVHLRPVAVLHAGLARRHARPAPLLPDHRDGDRLRHPVLLGGAHDHAGAGLHQRHPVRDRVPARPGARRAGPQDVQDHGQRARPDRAARWRQAGGTGRLRAHSNTRRASRRWAPTPCASRCSPARRRATT